MELLAPAELGAAQAALPARCVRYLDKLPLAMPARAALEAEIIEALRGRREAERERAAMEALHRALAGDALVADAAYASVHPRLELALGSSRTADAELLAEDQQHHERLVTAPPLNRSSMVPRQWKTPPRAKPGDADAPPHAGSTQRERWHRAGAVRRTSLLVIVLVQTIVAAHFMTAVLPYHGTQPLEIAMLALFGVLFFWISGGFWTAMAGFLLLIRGGDRFAISRTADGSAPIDPQARTAIVMPIANESVGRVFAGLRATYESLARTGSLARFDFYVLSDSNDPEIRLAEIAAWVDLCRAVKGFGRVYYRWRLHRIKRKSGNIADFCRRWGKNYRYMIVLDADSVMSGECLTRLVRLSEANPDTGIIQTAPRAAGRDTLYARMQQFATRLYGPLFTAGLHFWQLGESHYWGHNAIIRVEPFMRHCALARLPGRGNLSGEILSHDFVEAALMRRAGWAVWIAYDLPGSYEEMPPNLVDELKRDRRWCQGNLMNLRLFTLNGLHPAHRAVFMTGVMAYVSAPLWFLFLILSTALLAWHTLTTPEYFVQPYQLFPVWPEWHPEWALSLFTATATLLFLPKLLAAALRWGSDAKHYGGRVVVTAGMAAELVFSALLAPIRMLFHTEFVLGALLGFAVRWKSPPRDDAETSWGEAFRRHGVHTLIGVVWASGVYWLNPSFLWWLLPVVGALMLSIPMSVLTSRVRLGRLLRKHGFFVIPEELEPPIEIRHTRRYWRKTGTFPSFRDAAVEPIANALACATGVARLDRAPAPHADREALITRAVQGGPGSLSPSAKSALMSNPLSMSKLHFQIWTRDDAHADWRIA